MGRPTTLAHPVWTLSLALCCLGPASSARAAPAVADSVRACVQSGRYDAALQRLDEVWSSVDSTDCAAFSVFLDLTIAHGQAGRAREPSASVVYSSARRLAERCHGADSVEFGRALKAGADLYAFRAEWSEAAVRYGAAIPLLEAGGESVRSTLAVARANLGLCYRRTGRHERAEEVLEQALALQKEIHGSAHPALAGTLSNLGSVRRDSGDYQGSREAHRRALRILEQSGASEDVTLARTLVNLANLEADLEEFGSARERIERALRIFEARRGPEDELTVDTRLNLASMLNDMGSHDEALELARQVTRSYESRFGLEDSYLAFAYDVHAQILADRGDHAEAIALATRSLDLVARDEGPASFFLVYSLAVLVQSHRERGELERAEELLRRAVAITRAELGEDSPRLIPLRLEQGELALRRGRPDLAETHRAEARRLLVGNWATAHPWRARAALLAARIAVARQARAAAIDSALVAEQISRAAMRRAMHALGERRALALTQRRIRGADLALDLLATQPEKAARVWDEVIRSRGLVFEEIASRRRDLRRSDDPTVEAMRAESRRASARFVNLQLRDPGEVQDYRATLTSARRAMESAERRLVAVGEGSREPVSAQLPGATGVAAALSSDQALVAYVTYEDRAGSRRLGAFTSGSRDGAVRWHPLGRLDRIEGVVQRWREQAAHGEGQSRGLLEVSREPAVRLETYAEVARQLRRLVWDPLQESVRTKGEVIVVPSGPLHLVAFDALVDEDGRFLVEGPTALRLFSTERSLLTPAGDLDEGVTVVGDPLLGRGPRVGTGRPEEGAPSTVCAQSYLGDLAPLSGAREEALAVARCWEGRRPVKLLVGEEATETRTREALRGQRILHLASHGFSLPRSCLSVSGWMATDHPLVRTGVFLGSDGEGSPEGTGDGWWTAQEIAGMDLRGMECAILSACDTALGELRPDGEGLYGLRRAFEVAGVRSTVLGLWSVGDDAARDWMTALHRIAAQEGVDMTEAARRSHRAVLESRRAAGRSVHPFHWAGFVAVGRGARAEGR